MWTPTPRQNPDEWGAANRVYPETAGIPGPRDPGVTPYMAAWARAAATGRYSRVVMCCGAQMGKTDTQLDIIGEKMDRRPSNMIYVGPSKEFNTDQFEPRLEELFGQSAALRRKRVEGGKRDKKTLKRIAGVRIRLAHAGSSTALKSDPMSVALVDEIDEMMANIKGQGDPLGLIEARGFTFADFRTIIASTPSVGMAETEVDAASGLEFWKPVDPRDVSSHIWRLFQSGSMFHWAWPCPHCRAFFIPMFKHLRWPDEATSIEARNGSWIECPACHAAIDDSRKERMNAQGLFVAPGQRIERGRVVGEPAYQSNTISFWVSGLASPFQTWGQRAEKFVQAEEEGDPDAKQTAVNAGLGELYTAAAGEVPDWKHVLKLQLPYAESQAPDGVILVTAGIDVQANRLVVVIRGWGIRATSWLLLATELWGRTDEVEVWEHLSALLDQRFGGRPVKIAFVDSGFRPGKPNAVPENRVYDFCRNHARFVFPAKGSSSSQKVPVIDSRIEVKTDGRQDKYGLLLKRLDPDYWKRWVHERLTWKPTSPGAWFLYTFAENDDKTMRFGEYYARQIVSEARTVTPTGRPEWVKRGRDNHFLDAEAMAAAAGYMLNVQRITGHKHGVPDADTEVVPIPAEAVAAIPQAPKDTFNRFAKMGAAMNKRP